MKEKILEISKKLENNKITEQEAKNQFLFLFGVIKRPIKLTKEQEKRIDLYWDRKVLDGLIHSNYPRDMMEEKLKSILLIDNIEEFKNKSNEFGLLKVVL